MVIEEQKIFNLADTNGRRKDVLNALKIYLEILTEMRKEYPSETWSNYPNSIAQFVFYEKALEKSKDFFKKHDGYDDFVNKIKDCRQLFISKNPKWISANFSSYRKSLDEHIEARARHYSSNLVKVGFATRDREITEAGRAYLTGSIARDDFEELLPLDNINIVLLRQLAKIKIFAKNIDGKRKFYSPFCMAMVLLLRNEPIDIKSFEVIVQGLNPYLDEKVKECICNKSINVADLRKIAESVPFEIPDVLKTPNTVEKKIFYTVFKSSKSNATTQEIYYKFYISLENFRKNKNEDTYMELVKCFDEHSSILNKAFGYGRAVFEMGNKGSRYSMDKFNEKNRSHLLLSQECLIEAFYAAYRNSKHIDKIREYSDTTTRLLSATGLFKFKNLSELSYKEILLLIFDINQLRENVFGEMTEEEYVCYEEAENSYFGRSTSLTEILNYSNDDISERMEKIEKFLGVSARTDVKEFLNEQKNMDFVAHINSKYPKEKIMELLPLFSDRKKDRQIQSEVNDAATVPTIYEYIIGIAWYYISNKEFDLYNSLNLTLNADFEPVIHAGGGDGDIIIHYGEMILMLEVTLMNKQAQKRGEWEPVLRHSLNLKAANEPKETLTFFIADELDYNTINIWRAVALVSLESTNTHTKVDGVTIMPFTNQEILTFLKENVYYKDIVKAVRDSFAKVPQIVDIKWHEEIMSELIH